MLNKLEHSEKVHSLIFATPSGIITLFKLVHSSKAPAQITLVPSLIIHSPKTFLSAAIKRRERNPRQ